MVLAAYTAAGKADTDSRVLAAPVWAGRAGCRVAAARAP